MDYNKYSTLVLERSGSICYVCDADTYELLFLTKSCMEVCGVKSQEEYKGKKCYQLLQGLDEPCPFCPNNKLAEGQDYCWEHHNKNLGRWFDVTDTLVQIDGRMCRLEIAKDITSRKDAVALPSARLSMEDVLLKCLNTLSSESDLDTAFNLFLETIGTFYNANRAYIFEFDLKRHTLDNTFEWCNAGVSAEIDNLQNIPIAVVEDWINKFESDGEFSITSLGVERDPGSDEYRILEAQGIESLMAAPLRREGVIVGFIGVDDPRRNTGNLTLLRSVSEFIVAELEKRRLMAELENMSYVDVLTGLKNRNYYRRVLHEYDSQPLDSLGIITVDINGLRGINDTYGMSYGDYVIKQTADVIRGCLEEEIYRIAGGEFVALFPNILKEDFQEKVIALRNAFEGNRECSVAIGCAWSFDGVDAHKLFHQAEELRQAEKQSYYHNVLNEGRTISRTGFIGEVLKEIEENRFVVFYQPQVDIRSGKVVGAEALVRKRADDGSLIPPGKFIPFYEAGGVISYVDLFVMRTACAAVRQWIDRGLSLHVSVNFSRVTLMEPNIVEVISDICAGNGVPASSIIIEVTESISQMEDDHLKGLLKKLTGAGFTISLDDFGSQYSNLAILSAMEFDEVKFDRALVSSLEHNGKSRVVMKHSIRMCHELGDTIALSEGIETRGQLDMLLEYQCDYGQGYYFSKPISLEAFDLFLREHPTACSLH